MNKKDKVTTNELLAIKASNRAKLTEILDNPNYMEELGRKYYGNHWRVIFAGERHPLAMETEASAKNNERAKQKRAAAKMARMQLEEED